jgi:hypothetical protein
MPNMKDLQSDREAMEELNASMQRERAQQNQVTQEAMERAMEQVGVAPLQPSTAGPNHILHKAYVAITGDRNADYGDARKDFLRQAKMWNLILGLPINTIQPRQVAMCMIATKLCREIHKPKFDNRLDMIGYAALLDYVTQEPSDE